MFIIRRIDVEFVSNVYRVDHKPVIQCNVRDITARQQSEEQIARLAKFPSENPFPALRLSRCASTQERRLEMTFVYFGKALELPRQRIRFGHRELARKILTDIRRCFSA